jgi:signal transduction histidine kinase
VSPTVPDPQLIATLKSKAMLLIERERELFELRDQRRRTEEWLRVFHSLSLNLHEADKERLVATWAELVVGQLSFEIAGAIEYDRADGRVVFQHFDPGPIVELTTLAPPSRALLEARPNGSCTREAPPEVGALARQVGLERFFWLSYASRAGSGWLVVAGSSARSAMFHALPDHDHAHFVMLGNHLAALLDSSGLVTALEAERRELQQTNGELDASLLGLRETQAQLIESSRMVAEASRRAGMADIATGVLHNVGNVLTSVNVSAEVIASSLSASRVGKLVKLGELLEQQSAVAADERGGRAVAYLKDLARHLVEERDDLLGEVQRLRQHVGHIKTIVSKQQSYARTGSLSETCSVSQLMDDALILAESSFGRHRIEVVRDYAPLPDAQLERHKILQILVNLVTNASEALSLSERDGRRIVARVRPNGPLRMALQIEDNGAGISDLHLQRMFTHGFTTKPEGHGFGLHTSALAAREMGGSLSCHSDGPGRGALFTLELPLGESR